MMAGYEKNWWAGSALREAPEWDGVTFQSASGLPSEHAEVQTPVVGDGTMYPIGLKSIGEAVRFMWGYREFSFEWSLALGGHLHSLSGPRTAMNIADGCAPNEANIPNRIDLPFHFSLSSDDIDPLTPLTFSYISTSISPFGSIFGIENKFLPLVVKGHHDGLLYPRMNLGLECGGVWDSGDGSGNEDSSFIAGGNIRFYGEPYTLILGSVFIETFPSVKYPVNIYGVFSSIASGTGSTPPVPTLNATFSVSRFWTWGGAYDEITGQHA